MTSRPTSSCSTVQAAEVKPRKQAQAVTDHWPHCFRWYMEKPICRQHAPQRISCPDYGRLWLSPHLGRRETPKCKNEGLNLTPHPQRYFLTPKYRVVAPPIKKTRNHCWISGRFRDATAPAISTHPNTAIKIPITLVIVASPPSIIVDCWRPCAGKS